MMNIYDFNIHLPCKLKNSPSSTIADEKKLSQKELEFCYSKHLATFKKYITCGNFMVFNQQLFNEGDITFCKQVKKDFQHSFVSLLTDFRRDDIFTYLDHAIAQGIDAIKFHSYVQQISEADFSEVLKVAKYAEEKQILILLDTSYGTSKMYLHDNIKLACFLSEYISKVPLILLHSGASRVIEAMLLAEERKNIYLDTSFSLPYLMGSSLEQDFAFAYKKIGYHRILYGSDFPYVSMENSIECNLKFLDKYNFSSTEIENIMYNNAMCLRNG